MNRSAEDERKPASADTSRQTRNWGSSGDGFVGFVLAVVAVVAGWICDRETSGDIPNGRLPRLSPANTYGQVCDHAVVAFVLLALSFLVFVVCDRSHLRWTQSRKGMAIFLALNVVALTIGTIVLVRVLDGVLNVYMPVGLPVGG